MAETKHSKREKQPISVPFVWEDRPGIPKKDWKPLSQPAKPPAPPAKFIVSVPFGWETKPGTPLPSFVQPRKEPEVVAASQELSNFTGYGCKDKQEYGEVEESSDTKLDAINVETDDSFCSVKSHTAPEKFIVSVPFGWEVKPGTPLPFSVQNPKERDVVAASGEHPYYSVTGYGSKDEQGEDEAEELSDLELDTCSVATDDSFSSAKSLLANGLISTAVISSAVPVQQTSLALITTDSGLLQSLGSPVSETDSISSYATGTTSLAGASFLEWLFPLLVPNSNVANKGGYLLENAPYQSADIQTKELVNGSQVRRPPLLTLGELIAMSRRRSCQRKINKMHMQQSMDIMKRDAFGCCFFGTGNRINQLQLKWKRHLQLKLM